MRRNSRGQWFTTRWFRRGSRALRMGAGAALSLSALGAAPAWADEAPARAATEAPAAAPADARRGETGSGAAHDADGARGRVRVRATVDVVEPGEALPDVISRLRAADRARAVPAGAGGTRPAGDLTPAGAPSLDGRAVRTGGAGPVVPTAPVTGAGAAGAPNGAPKGPPADGHRGGLDVRRGMAPDTRPVGERPGGAGDGVREGRRGGRDGDGREDAEHPPRLQRPEGPERRGGPDGPRRGDGPGQRPGDGARPDRPMP